MSISNAVGLHRQVLIRALAALFVPALLFCHGPAGASYITMETETSASRVESGVEIKLSATNRGDEEAHHVQPEVRLLGQAIAGPLRQSLRPGELYSWKTTVEVQKDSLLPGRYPIFIVLDYTDRNLYPFSAVSATYMDSGKGRPSHVSGRIPTVEISHKGKIEIRLSNQDDHDRNVTLKMVGPRELSLKGMKGPLFVKARSEISVSSAVTNLSALSGSSYRVYAAVEYEEAGVHFSTAIPGIVTIGSSESPVRRYRWVLIGLGVLLFVLLMAVQLIRRRGSR